MRHPVPTHARQQAFAIITEAGRINLSQSGETVTLESLRAALKASQALHTASRDMTICIRQQLNAALRAEDQARREAAKAERRNARIRAERGLPPLDGDFAMPGMPS